PRALRTPLTILIDLLAAVPSVVYGLWGVFVLIPRLKPAEQWFADTFSFLPFVGGHVAGPNFFIAGLILAIMILPIVSAISREVIATVPADLKEASLALGATRWERIRMTVLPSRPSPGASHERDSAVPDLRAPSPDRQDRARRHARADARRAGPARAGRVLPAEARPRRTQLGLLHHRSHRQLLRRPGRRPQ